MDGGITMDGGIQRQTFMCLWLAVFMCCGVGGIMGMDRNAFKGTIKMLKKGLNIYGLDEQYLFTLNKIEIDSSAFEEQVKSLLRQGVNANSLRYNEHLAIDLAMFTKNAKVLEMLLKAKADPNAEMPMDCVPRDLCTWLEFVKFEALFFFRQYDGAIPHSKRPKMLIFAIIFGFNDGVKLLLEYGANPNISYHFFSSAGFIWNMTALHEAVMIDNEQAVKLLLMHGADGSAQMHNYEQSAPFLLNMPGYENAIIRINYPDDFFVIDVYSKVSVMQIAQTCINLTHNVVNPDGFGSITITHPNAQAIVDLLTSLQLSRLKRMRWNAWRKYQHAKRLGVNLKKGFVSRFKSFMAMFARQPKEAVADQ